MSYFYLVLIPLYKLIFLYFVWINYFDLIWFDWCHSLDAAWLPNQYANVRNNQKHTFLYHIGLFSALLVVIFPVVAYPVSWNLVLNLSTAHLFFGNLKCSQTTFCDAGPASNQHWFNASCLLDCAQPVSTKHSSTVAQHCTNVKQMCCVCW